MVRETSTWRIDSSHQSQPRSARMNGTGMRQIQPLKNVWTSAGLKRWQIACSRPG
jgi:hypothetical protein